jgi:thiol-disulfide isomerase/thioredoxin
MKKIIPFIIIFLFLAVLLTGCKKGDSQNSLVDTSVTASPTETDSDIGASGWNFYINTTDLYGEEITSKDLSQNKLVVLNIWATWCPPCIQELPELQKISDAFAEQGVQVVGVLQDAVTELGVPNEKTIQNALDLLENANASYTVIIPDETLTTKFINTMQYFPTTFFIDETGNVIHIVVGANDFEDWSKEIDEALEQLS